MTFRIQGLVPAFALLAMGVAHAQSNPVTPGRGPSDVGNMAYPAPQPAGNINTTPTAPARDTGNMALPAGTAGAPTVSVTRPRRPAAPKPAAMAATPAAAPAVAPTPDGMAAAKALDTAPGSAPVPYVDFSQPTPMKGTHAVMRGKKPMAVHKAAAKKAAPAATPAPAAAPAPAAK